MPTGMATGDESLDEFGKKLHIVRREMKYKIPYTRRVCPILPFAI